MIESVLSNLTADADWSVMITDVNSGDVLAARHPALVLQTASVGKLFLLIEVARQFDACLLDPSQRICRTTEDLLSYPSLSDSLSQAEFALADWAQLTGMVSDNTATNVLLGQVGLDAVTATTRELGFTASGLLDRVRSERLPGMAWTLSVGTAAELSDLLARLARGEVINPAVCAHVLDWISRNVDTTLVADAFRLDPLEHAQADRHWMVVNKTGTTSVARADVGSVHTPARTLAWAVIANWASGTDPRDQVIDDMRRIGWEIRAALSDPALG